LAQRPGAVRDQERLPAPSIHRSAQSALAGASSTPLR
jgi:hypothetical protein